MNELFKFHETLSLGEKDLIPGDKSRYVKNGLVNGVERVSKLRILEHTRQ